MQQIQAILDQRKAAAQKATAATAAPQQATADKAKMGQLTHILKPLTPTYGSLLAVLLTMG